MTDATTWITICDTCKRDGQDETTDDRPDGVALAELIERAARGHGVRTRRVSCLMGCTHGCNVAIQARGKMAYTLGRFEPCAAAAEAIVAWALLHATSATGQVPFRQWPPAIKGHFITRHPPLPKAEEGPAPPVRTR